MVAFSRKEMSNVGAFIQRICARPTPMPRVRWGVYFRRGDFAWAVRVVGGVRAFNVLLVVVLLNDYVSSRTNFAGRRLLDVHGKVALRRMASILNSPSCEAFGSGKRR